MHTSIVQTKEMVRTILSLWDFMYYLKDIPFFIFIFFLTQHEWSCFKHEKISFFLDLRKSVVRLKVIIELSQSFAK